MGILSQENLNAIRRIERDEVAEDERRKAEADLRSLRMTRVSQEFTRIYNEVLKPVVLDLDGELKSSGSWAKIGEPQKRASETEIVRAEISFMRPDRADVVKLYLVISDKGDHGEASFWQMVTEGYERKPRAVYHLLWPELTRPIFEKHINEVMKEFVLNPPGRRIPRLRD